MAATTMPSMTWVDDSGTPAAPAGDGTVINNSQLQTAIGKINQMFAGGAGFETFTVGGLFTAEGFGVHTFTASGTGTAPTINVRNTSAGSANASGFLLGNDEGFVGTLIITSSAYTTTPNMVQLSNGSTAATAMLRLIAANNATARIRLQTSGQFWDFDGSGKVGFGTASPGAHLDLGGGSVNNNRLFLFNDTTNKLGFGIAVNTLRIYSNISGTGIIEFGQLSAADVFTNRFTMAANGDWLPAITNAQDLGSNALRFAEIWGTAIFSGDLNFENGYSWTESYKAGVKTPGMAMTNMRGTVVLFVDGRGNVYVNKMKSLSELKRAV